MTEPDRREPGETARVAHGPVLSERPDAPVTLYPQCCNEGEMASSLERCPANEMVFRHWDRPEHVWPDDQPGTQRDLYLHTGSHPDCVERVWDGLGTTLPEDCRFLCPSTPATRSGIPKPPHAEAAASGLARTTTWSGGSVTDLENAFGAGWLFGGFVNDEVSWIAAAYAAASTPASTPW